MKQHAGGRRPRLRDDLVYGSHPDDPERGRVLVMRTGAQVEILPPVWRVASAFDGARSIDQLAEDSMRVYGCELDEALLSAIADELEGKGLLARAEGVAEDGGALLRRPAYRAEGQWLAVPRRGRLELSVHPDARFTCEGFGTCCESGYVVSLSSREVRRVREAASNLAGSSRDPPGEAASAIDPVRMMPTGMNAPWTYALAANPRCPFLGPGQECRLHGTAAQPSSCRIFPYRFVEGPERIHVSISHRCVCGTLGRGELLTKQRGEIQSRLDASAYVHAIPGTSRIDAVVSAPTDEVVEALVRACDGGARPFEILSSAVDQLIALGHPDPKDSSAARRPRILDPEALYLRLAGALAPVEPGQQVPSLRRALEGQKHALHRLIERHQKVGGVFEPSADPREEVGRFVRDQVFGLQIYRFSTLAAGILAVGLAAARILHGLPKGGHPVCRERIMLWENALGTRTLVGLLGPTGPLARVTSSIEAVGRQLVRLQAFSARRR